MTVPTPPSRTRGPKASRVEPAQILAAAERVFSDQGLRAASLRAIAAEAGCDPALIYYHFESKEAMFLALLDRIFPPLHEALVDLATQDHRPTAERLWEVLQLYHRHMGHHVGLRAIIRGELMRGAEGLQPQIAQRILRNAEQVARILREGQRRGELRSDLDPRLATFFLLKTFIETLDFAPRFGELLQQPMQIRIPEAVLAWFHLYWRGIAADPLTPLPALPEL
jgi:AcrR family transcriptional regulator